MICQNFTEPSYLLFSSEVPQLLYYSHFPAMILALLMGIFVFVKNRNLLSGILLALSLTFSAWIVVNLIAWTNINVGVLSWTFSFFAMPDMLIYLLSFYFVYVFINKKDVHIGWKTFFGFLFVFFAIFSYRGMTSFDFDNCGANEGGWYFNTKYIFELAVTLWILGYGIYKYVKEKTIFKKQIALVLGGIMFFLLSYLVTGFMAGYLADHEYVKDYSLEFYGLYGMTFFMAVLAYLIVQYKAFNIKLLGAQALVVGIIALIASQFAFIQNNTNRILTVITLAIVAIFGWWLVKSVKKVDEQKEDLEVANVALEKADQAKNEFINIASHQLRTPVTVIKGTISMLQDGTMDAFDAVTRKKFYDAARFKCQKLEDIINDILSATSLTNKKFSVMDKEVEKINVSEFLTKLVDGFKVATREREIDLRVGELDPLAPEIFGQERYLEEAFANLITNAIKYTPSSKKTPDIRDTREGAATITISSRREGDYSVIFSIKDNGIGIPPEAIPNLFQKFVRAKNAVDMYTDGTGLGLFIIREIVEGHGGKVWVESELGKGSEFFVQLPIRFTGKVDVKEYIRDRAEMKL